MRDETKVCLGISSVLHLSGVLIAFIISPKAKGRLFLQASSPPGSGAAECQRPQTWGNGHAQQVIA